MPPTMTGVVSAMPPIGTFPQPLKIEVSDSGRYPLAHPEICLMAQSYSVGN